VRPGEGGELLAGGHFGRVTWTEVGRQLETTTMQFAAAVL